MPAMPKEKTFAVSLNESTYPESGLKEQLVTTTAVVASTAAMGTGTTSVTNMSVSNLLEKDQQRKMCDCSADDDVDGSYNNKKYFIENEHSSPLAAAVASTGLVSSIQCDETCSDNHLQSLNNDKKSTKTDSNDSTITSSEAPNGATAITPPKKSAKDFIFRKYIGEGSFSTVYLAVDIHTKRQYAIKVCAKRQIVREHKQEYIRREREVMHMMTNVPGFVNLSCTFQDSRSLYFVMTFAKNGDLRPYINKVGSFDTDCTRHYVAELVLACEQMHCRNIVHRDLKPENILLDENMHTLIADFGSVKILTTDDRPSATDADIDDWKPNRRDSFVGTAQYISPEMLQNGPISPSIDLWALGCIVYQMISGLPPFRGKNVPVIFKEIQACNLEFPQGFDKDAEDLVRKLLKVDPKERLGAQDKSGKYESIRAHPFFSGIDFDTIRQQTPPPIYPYLPGVSKDEDFLLHMSENLEPGLGDKQITRLLGLELGTAIGSDIVVQNSITTEEKTATKNIFDLSKEEKQLRLEQQKNDKWHVFAQKEVILKKGYVNKRKGLFSRKRMLLLTTGPKLIYIDPVQMIKKGEIPWTKELRVEPKNFKIFFVHTQNRTYYLEDPEGYSLEWVNAIENMHMLRYQTATPTNEPDVTTIESSTIKTSST